MKEEIGRICRRSGFEGNVKRRFAWSCLLRRKGRLFSLWGGINYIWNLNKRGIENEYNIYIGRNNKYKLHWFVCVPTDLSLLKVVEPQKQKELKWIDLEDKTVNWTPKNFEALMQYKSKITEIQKSMKDE